MIDRNINIKLEHNPDYDSIIKKYNLLIKRFDKLNDDISSTKIPALYYKNHLKSYSEKNAKKVVQFQNDCLSYLSDAEYFLMNPKYNIPLDSEQEVTFLHYQYCLMNLLNNLRRTLDQLSTNYNIKFTELFNSRSFTIAFSSIVLSIVGLVLALAK